MCLNLFGICDYVLCTLFMILDYVFCILWVFCLFPFLKYLLYLISFDTNLKLGFYFLGFLRSLELPSFCETDNKPDKVTCLQTFLLRTLGISFPVTKSFKLTIDLFL